MRLYKPPMPFVLGPGERSVFLAGSIEMGLAEPWQDELTESLRDLDVAILNPRREAWDATWEQSISNPAFREQVEWELDALDRADLIAMYFAPTTKAPITLLELGLHAKSGKVIVACPEGFWRRGNVEVICARYGIPLLADLQSLTAAVRAKVG
ncbi:MAG: nucleoside 2-deoxyribosyltransferase domain-containing protein [Fimbriiglobus sp.]